MKKLFLAAVTATLGFAAAPSAMAQTTPVQTPGQCTTNQCTDADMDVRVTITGNCDYLEVGDLDFGTHPMVAGSTAGATNRDAQTTLDVRCMNNIAYNVELDYGIQPNGTTQRRVKGEGTEMIDYDLFKDAARSQPWGMATVQAGTAMAGTGTGTYQNLTVYGRLRQTSTNPAGTYTDLVTATLNFQ